MPVAECAEPQVEADVVMANVWFGGEFKANAAREGAKVAGMLLKEVKVPQVVGPSPAVLCGRAG